ncbi:MAG TPA: hypothetical protein VIY86_05710, partial [Pirellulaceae bacterium]
MIRLVFPPICGWHGEVERFEQTGEDVFHAEDGREERGSCGNSVRSRVDHQDLLPQSAREGAA